MRFTSLFQYGVITAIAIASTSVSSHSLKNAVIQPKPSNINPIEAYEKNFNFDWNKCSSIALNKNKVKKTEAFVETYTDFSNLSLSDRQTLGALLYKLGTYYAHVTHEPDLAIEKMILADMLLINKQEKAWNYNHLAYAYEQKYITSKNMSDKENALDYVNQVIQNFYPNANNTIMAFAYDVKGQLLNDTKDFVRAEASYNTALQIYNKLPSGKDEQFVKIQSHLASVMLAQNNHNHEALIMLEKAQKYWLAKGNVDQNPYAANNLIALGQAHLKIKNTQMASIEFDKAIQIYKHLYGKENAMLVKPYQMLADAYKQQSNIKLASVYQTKADTLTTV